MSGCHHDSPFLKLIIDHCVSVLQPLHLILLVADVRTVFSKTPFQGVTCLLCHIQISAQLNQLILL